MNNAPEKTHKGPYVSSFQIAHHEASDESALDIDLSQKIGKDYPWSLEMELLPAHCISNLAQAADYKPGLGSWHAERIPDLRFLIPDFRQNSIRFLFGI